MSTSLPGSSPLVNAFLREIQRGTLPDVLHLQRQHAPSTPSTSSPAHFFSLQAFLGSSNRHGDTAFLVAAREGHVALLEVLHGEHGVPLEQRNADGKTALHEAAQSGQISAIRYLLTQGAVLDALKRADW